jgi:hypothetical protein
MRKEAMQPYGTLVEDAVVEESLLGNVAMRYLVSDRPSPELKDELATFGRLVGSWDIAMTAINPDGSREEFVAEWHFGWALHGGAVQDVLITRRPDGELIGYGTTVRTYDPRRGVWWIVWQDPLPGEFSVLLARPEGDRVVLEGQWTIGASGPRFRWTFSEVSDKRFRWECHVSRDDGTTWLLVEEMEATRRDAPVKA